MKKGSFVFLGALLVIYFGINLYYNYKAETMSVVPETTAEELAVCSLNELSGNRISLTIPKTYVYGATQEDLNKIAEMSKYEAIDLNPDGSATYTITKEQHEKMLSDLSTGINDKLITMPGSEHFKDIDKVTANADFTDYTVILSRDDADFDSSMASMNLKMYTTMYNAFRGITDETMHIKFINQDGSIVAEFDSSIMPEDK